MVITGRPYPCIVSSLNIRIFHWRRQRPVVHPGSADVVKTFVLTLCLAAGRCLFTPHTNYFSVPGHVRRAVRFLTGSSKQPQEVCYRPSRTAMACGGLRVACSAQVEETLLFPPSDITTLFNSGSGRGIAKEEGTTHSCFRAAS